VIEETPLAAAIYMGAFVIGALSFMLGAVEALATWRLSTLAFRLGLRVLNEERPFPSSHSGPLVGKILETETGKYRFTERGECLFRCKSRTFGRRGSTRYVLPFEQRIVTPFAIKGIICWRGGQAMVTGRIPLFVPIFLLAWLLAWSVPAVLMIGAGRDILVGGAVLLLGCSAVVGLGTFSVPFELRRARTVLSELERQLKSAAA